jgi:MFS transporter, DHA2 family, multidrug resistance protein
MDSDGVYPQPRRRIAIIVVVMAASIMQILDTTIANVALPHMQASLGATQEQISWVITSYIVATAIVIPATGFLEGLISRRVLFIVSVAGFTLSSAFCGLAWNLPVMVVARILQGLFGAFISPLGQAIIFDTSPPEKRGQAMTIWGMGVMIAPIMGPVLGGWLTEELTWRWVFFVNVPIGLITVIAAFFLLINSPSERRSFDWRGYAMIAIGLAALQLGLDRGTQLDWFDSIEIIVELCLAGALLWMYIIHTRTSRAPIIARDVFVDRNMMIACIFTIASAGSLIGGAVFITLMLQGLFGYGTIDAGLMGVPRALSMTISMLIAGRMTGRIDPRIMMGCGLFTVGIGYLMMSGFSLQMDRSIIISAGVLQGFGFGFVMIPMNLLGFSTLAARFRTEGASIYAIARNIGSSVMIALGGASIARNVQISHNDMASQITNETVPVLNAGLFEQLGIRGEAMMTAMNFELTRQSLMIAYINIFYATAILSFLVVPLILLAKPVKAVPNGVMPLPDAH